MANVPAVRELFCATGTIRMTNIGITMCFVCPPKREFAQFDFLLHFENEIYTGIYEWK